MENNGTIINGMRLQVQLAAAPAVRFFKKEGANQPEADNGFTFQFSAGIDYENLTRLANGYLAGKRFELSEGLLSSYVVVQQINISADEAGHLIIRVPFGGSFGGTIFLKGAPVLDAATDSLSVNNLSYDIETGSFLLRMAKSLLQNKIRSELLKRTVFPLQPYEAKIKAALEGMLNKQWGKGVSGAGTVSAIKLHSVTAQPQHLLVEGSCTGNLEVTIEVP